MNTNLVASWPKDFETGLNIVPPGEFTDFGQYPSSSQPARVRKLPVLRGCFDNKKFDLNPSLPTHIGYGCIMLYETLALTLRIQRGDSMLYWLANPADAHVWAIFDRWAASNAMVLAAEFADDQVLLVHRACNLKHPVFAGFRDLIKDPDYTAQFVKDAARALASDRLSEIATSDIPSCPQLKHVQGCLVRTEQTGGVAMMMSDKEPGPGGPTADAVEALIKAMTQPDQPRH